MVKKLDHRIPKVCKVCLILKPVDEFGICAKTFLDGVPRRRALCLVCSMKKERLAPEDILYKECSECSTKFPQHGRKQTCSKKCHRIKQRKTKKNTDESRWSAILSRNDISDNAKKLLLESESLKTIARHAVCIKHKYGITAEDYLNILETQGNVCAICKNKETAIDKHSKRVKNLAVDHNHKTGKVRGLLCSACNRGIGYFKEDKRSLYEAIEYLKKYEE
jgi:hypothetical protein